LTKTESSTICFGQEFLIKILFNSANKSTVGVSSKE
jgi:hypothetical protein